MLPQGRTLEIPRGLRGVLKAKFLEEKYEATLEFPGGEGVQNKKPLMEEYAYFLEVHDCTQSPRPPTQFVSQLPSKIKIK